MITKINNIAPAFFAVYYPQKGNPFKKIQSEIDFSDLSNYPNIKKIELYKNGTENLSPVLVDSLINH